MSFQKDSNCIFKRARRTLPAWSGEFEKGFSQIVDWAWAHDIYKATPPFASMFGSVRLHCVGILVIGRDSELSDETARDRWDWRSTKIRVDGWFVNLLTYDELFFHLDTNIKGMLTHASQAHGRT